MGVYVYKESTDELQKIAGLGLEEKDTQMSDTSTNAVQNKTIKSYVDNRIDNINVGIDTTNDEYEQWKILGQLKENTDYYIEDIGLDEYDAENMSFDNTRKQLGSSVQTAIEAVDDKCIALNANIKQLTKDIHIHATTDAGGDIDLPVAGTDKKIIYAYNSANLFVVPRYIVARGCWGVKVLSDDWIPVANIEVDIYYALG